MPLHARDLVESCHTLQTGSGQSVLFDFILISFYLLKILRLDFSPESGKVMSRKAEYVSTNKKVNKLKSSLWSKYMYKRGWHVPFSANFRQTIRRISESCCTIRNNTSPPNNGLISEGGQSVLRSVLILFREVTRSITIIPVLSFSDWVCLTLPWCGAVIHLSEERLQTCTLPFRL